MTSEYKIKQIKKDFLVEEIFLSPDFCSPEKAEFTYLWIKKEGITTFEALDKIKNILKLNSEDVAAQGLKDEDAITQQLISVKEIIFDRELKKINKKFNSNKQKLEIQSIKGYGTSSLKPRLLHGNKFKLIIRNLNKNSAKYFYDYCQSNRFMTFINYYDNQRFGISGGPYNTHLIGKGIIEGNYREVLKQLKKSKDVEFKNIKEKILKDGFLKKMLEEINFLKLKFFISSYNSYLWNKSVSEYLLKDKNNKNYYFPNIGNLFLPKKDLFILPNIFSVNSYDINEDYKIFKTTTSRNLSVTTTVFPFDIKRDELNKNKYCLRVDFLLPTGCYATMLIRQIFIKLNNYSCREK